MEYIAPKVSRSHKSRTFASRITFIALAAFTLLMLATTSALMLAPISGAIFTTDSTCTGTNVNIFSSKNAVYLDGGPAHPGAAGLPDGEYYVKVTEPNGTLLGTSVGSGDDTPVVVVGGEFAQCYQLIAILIKASDSSQGYDDTSNPGGEYKVWVSNISTFDNSDSKTDNFKVKCTGEDCDENPPPPPTGQIDIIKYYDLNTNGLNDDGLPITGWRMRIQDTIDFIRFTPVSIVVDAPDTYTVTESEPVETNWLHTTPSIVIFPLAVDEIKTVEFGNVCLGAGGGLTLGFWSNKNGQAKMNDGGSDASERALLSALCLRNANGSDFNPANYAQFRSWILSASATNMAYMLSAQLAAMELNVEGGNVNGGSIIYAPGAPSANAFGFATVNDVMNDANNALCADGVTLSGDPNRAVQEALKNALDKANNNLNFVQSTPCPFSFAPLP